MAGFWTTRQFKDVIHRFRDRECRHLPDVWDEVLVSLAIIRERGPYESGPQIAKKLADGDGIWELIAKFDNYQPRLFFYVRQADNTLVFVHAILKKGKQDYGPAVKLSQQRRTSIERGNGPTGTIH